MSRVAFVAAGRLTARTGGSIYNRRMVEALAQHGWAVDVHELDDSFPFPTEHALQHAARLLMSIDSGRLVVIDGLAFGAMPDVVEHESARLRLVALLHLPLSATVGLDPEMTAHLTKTERRALAKAERVIVTGERTLALMAACGISHPRLTVVEPGTDAAPLAMGSGAADVQMLTVATLNAGKGYEILIEALAMLRHRRWRLTCAGSVERHPEVVQDLRATITRLGLDAQVTLAGELSEAELDACYHRSDVFVLASLRETYGMVVAEALARGLPVVATATGAIPNLVGDDAGLVVPPGDRAALAAALSRIVDDEALRTRCALGARRVRDQLPDWDDAAARLAAALSV